MAEYDNTNGGVLFINNKKETADDPDSTGSLHVGDIEHWFDAWKADDTLTLAFRPKDAANGVKSGTGTMKRTDKDGKAENYPDWKGEVRTGDGQRYFIAGWRRESSKTGIPFLSLRIKKPQRPSDQQGEPAAAAAEHQSDDEEPF